MSDPRDLAVEVAEIAAEAKRWRDEMLELPQDEMFNSIEYLRLVDANTRLNNKVDEYLAAQS